MKSIKFTLFICRSDRRFERFLKKWMALCAELALKPQTLTVTDLSREPAKADEFGIIMTPTILIETADKSYRFVGNPLECIRSFLNSLGS